MKNVDKNEVFEIDSIAAKKNKALFFAIGFFTIFIMCTDGLFPLPKSGYIDIWSMCNWGLSYDTGFIIRGFIGTILTIFTDVITFKLIYILSFILFIILVIQFLLINISVYKKSQTFTAFILIFFLMAQPSNARWFLNGTMFARLDSFIIIIALISFFVVYKFDKALMYLLLIPLSIIAILIHEFFAVAFSSLIFALIMIKTYLKLGKLSIRPFLAYYLPVVLFFIVVTIFGGTDLTREKFTMIMQQNLEVGLQAGMISVARDVVVDDLAMKIERTQYLFTNDTRNLMILTYVVMSPTLILVAGMIKKLFKSARDRHEGISIIIIFGACLAPLTSSFFGSDQFRWIGYFIFCISIAIVFLYFLNEKYRKIILEYVKKNAYYFIIASVIAMTFGTFRVMQTMPFLESIYYNRIIVIPEFF